MLRSQKFPGSILGAHEFCRWCISSWASSSFQLALPGQARLFKQSSIVLESVSYFAQAPVGLFAQLQLILGALPPHSDIALSIASITPSLGGGHPTSSAAALPVGSPLVQRGWDCKYRLSWLLKAEIPVRI
ncbi:MAG: hypothetical protein EBV03_13170 [Proteobacteria bacterium]|nr:hypothetical protein [Pseudomonadota bacterium]